MNNTRPVKPLIIIGVMAGIGLALSQINARVYTVTEFIQEGFPDDDSTDKKDSLKFPIIDRKFLEPDASEPGSIDLNDPSNIREEVTYDPDSNVFYLDQYINDLHTRPSTYMDYDDYTRYRFNEDEQQYFQQRLEALSLFNQKPELPALSKDGVFNRLFGGLKLKIEPQGTIELTGNGFWENRENFMIPENNRKFFVPEFNMQMNVNLVAQIGDKMKLNISNNTNPSLLNQNLQKVEYTGKEDEIIKKIELGNVDFPLRSNLISGVQSLFGIKTQLQFGDLWVTSTISQQRSQRRSMVVQGGGQNQPFEIRADNYEENRNFLLGQYFRNNYNKALENYPIINSQVQITKIEVWITNRTGAVTGVRDIVSFMDLGEKNPYYTPLTNPSGTERPDNKSNTLYSQLLQDPATREQSTASAAIMGIGLTEGVDFQRATMRQLNPSEYSFQPQLGYITLTSTVNPDDVLAVSYRYTYNGAVHTVGEFSDELPPDTASQRVIFSKLIKGVANRPALPIWDLMMKNVYSLGYGNVAKEDFRLNIFYLDPGGGEKRYLPEGPQQGIPILTLLNLDRLNQQNDPQPDGIFDYVEGITINSQQGKIIFPVLEPFGSDLRPALGGDPALERKYLYQILYDSTKVIAQQRQQNNRFVVKGTYKSSIGSDIFLGGMSIPEGSVTVSAGGTVLQENVDYQVDYASGRLKILNQGILNSGLPLNIQYEDNAAFGMVQQNFIGTRLDYFLNEKLTLGATYMKLSERPFGYKARYGDDPINNTVLGADAAYQSELPGLTKLLDKLPFYSTNAPSMVAATVEGAALLPGHHKFVNIDGDGSGGTQYLDDFEGNSRSIDLRFPAFNWTLSSIPRGAKDAAGNELFPEANLNNDWRSGYNRANLAWYTLEPNLITGNNTPPGVKGDISMMNYWRMVDYTQVFPNRTAVSGQTNLTTFDLAYYPSERGPYNFDATNIDADGRLLDPKSRWGGIQRSIDNVNSDFEAANVEYLTFWVMDPFIYNATSEGGYLYINLGNVSEDILKDGRMAFENGIEFPKNRAKLDQTAYGFIPKFQQQITRSFLNEPNARAVQDVGYDLYSDDEEREFFKPFIDQLSSVLPTGSPELARLQADPANDNFIHFRNTDYDANSTSALNRYRRFNRPHGNTPILDNEPNSTPGTAIPESEDMNRDNTLNESEAYYQYRIRLVPNMNVGDGFVVDKRVADVRLQDGSTSSETWYQFKVPIRSYDEAVGGIGDFRSIRFIRMFMNDFADSVILRFAQLQLDGNNWRRYQFSLLNPGENIPEEDMETTSYALTNVSLEQNANKQPVPYVMPPGIIRQEQPVTSGQNVQLDEQSISLQVCGLKDGDARAIFREMGNVDLRQYEKLKMFIHAESIPNQDPLNNGDVWAYIRIGSDFTHNYYEYQIPLEITLPVAPGAVIDPNAVWPEKNRMEIDLKALVALKNARNDAGVANHIPYSETDAKGNKMVVIGNPNIAEARNVMLGILNPKKTLANPSDDGQRKCAEVWFNELRMTGMNEEPGYAASASVNMQLADLGNIQLAGSMHTVGYGNINQKLNERFRDQFTQFNGTTNLQLGKLMPRKWGVSLPVFFGYSENISTPQYDPYDKDVLLKDKLMRVDNRMQTRKDAQDFNSITSFNINNLRITGDPESTRKFVFPWSIKNFDFNYAYNRQFKRNPLLESDELTEQRLGVGYTYKIKPLYIEPFKNLFKNRSAWWNIIKDININPFPSNFTFRNDLRRLFGETIVRNIDDSEYGLPPLYFKNFTWDRTYNLNWELTRSLSVGYTATNQARIDEPYGRIDSREKRDTLLNNLKRFGRNTYYTHDINATYNIPFKKIPALDWITLTATYNTQYFWTASSLLAKSQGNIISNNQSKQLNGQFNFTQLYNKSRHLKALNKPATREIGTVGMSDRFNKGKDKEAEKGGKENTDKKTTKPGNQTLPPKPRKRKITVDSIPGHDTMAHKLLRQKLRERKNAEKIRYRKELLAWRKKKQSIIPEMSDGVKIAGRFATMLKNVTVNLSEDMGTILPGYMDSTNNFGLNNTTFAPGLFAFGYQPNRQWLDDEARAGRITTDSIFNGLFQQQFSQRINLRATLEPVPDLRIDLTYNSNFRKNYSEIYKYSTDDNAFMHYNPYDMGSFDISFIGIKTLFSKLSANEMSENFRNMLNYRPVISRRLGELNPYTAGLPDPLDPQYAKGYGRYSQDVLIPAFIAAYTGKDPGDAPLIIYENRTTRNNPFRNFKAMPNWSITYNGLAKVGDLKDYIKTFNATHTYSGTLSMNSFMSHLLYTDLLGIGFPSFIDSVSNNYVPYFLVPNITVTEQFAPLLGVDINFHNSLSVKVLFNKSRTLSLSLVDYQVSEMRSSEIVVGAGYRLQGMNLPFSFFGLKRLQNDINIRVDLGYRDDITVNSFMATEFVTATRGQKVITIAPSIDYIINDQLQLRLFYDRRQSIPYIQQTFPITTTRAGITLRYIFDGTGF